MRKIITTPDGLECVLEPGAAVAMVSAAGSGEPIGYVSRSPDGGWYAFAFTFRGGGQGYLSEPIGIRPTLVGALDLFFV